MIATKELTCVNSCGCYLIPSEYEGQTVQVCPQCKGIWLHPEELNAIMNKVDKVWSPAHKQYILSEKGKTGIPQTEIERHLNCPECGKPMPPINFQYSSGIIIHKCKYHHGIWLDRGELNQIQIYVEHCNATK